MEITWTVIEKGRFIFQMPFVLGGKNCNLRSLSERYRKWCYKWKKSSLVRLKSVCEGFDSDPVL